MDVHPERLIRQIRGLVTILNNREISIVIWTILPAIVIAGNTKTRQCLSQVLKALFVRPILTALVLMAVYVALEVLALRSVSLWKWGQLKATIVWTIAVGATTLVNLNQIVDNEEYFRKAIRGNFKVAVLIDFVVNVPVLNLFPELIFIPCTTLLAGLMAVAESNLRYAAVKRLLEWLLIALGLCILIYSLVRIFRQPTDFFQMHTLHDLLLPLLLSILYLPFIYMYVIYMIYQDIFLRLQYFVADPRVIRYTKILTIMEFRLNRSILREWASSLGKLDLHSSRQDVKEVIQRFKANHNTLG